MKALRKIGDFYNKIESHILVGSLIVTVILISYQVIMRYIFKNSSFWSEELARYIFIWQIWMGASTGFKDNKHITIELLTGRLKGKAKIAFSLLSNLLMLAFNIFLIYYGWLFLKKTAMLKMVTPALRIPFTAVYAALPASSAALAIRLVITIISEVKLLCGPSSAIPTEGGDTQ